MTKRETAEKKEVDESHTLWADMVLKRTETYNDESNWYPFIQSIEDVLKRMSHLSMQISDLDNKIGETQGMIKNLRKVLIKLEIVDDRFVL